jgi:hypothetical protein
MKNLFRGILIIFVITQFAVGQEVTLKKKLYKYVPTCLDIKSNAAELIMKLHEQEKLDSIKLILTHWYKDCGASDLWYRSNVLLDIAQKRYQSINAKEAQVANLYRFWNSGILSETYIDLEENLSNYPVLKRYHLFLINWASCLSKEQVLGSEELLICLVYANQYKDINRILRDERYASQALHHKMIEKRSNWLVDLRGLFAISSGVWIPSKELSLLGVHPSFGMCMGVTNRKIQIYLKVEARTGNAKKEYKIVKDGMAVNTQDYLGGYFGIQGTYPLIDKDQHKLRGLLSLGWESIHTSSSQPGMDAFAKSIKSFAPGVGLSYRFASLKQLQLASSIRYDFLNFRNSGGTELKGNALTLSLQLFIHSSRTKKMPSHLILF